MDKPAVAPTENTTKMPTLEQFIDLIKKEQSANEHRPAAYNVYNKYNKTS